MTATKAELERHYQTQDGIIKSPGKFEGEPIWAPYFYDKGCEGFADADVGDGESEPAVWGFILRPEDRAEFPDAFEPDTYAVSLWETDSGFVYSNQLTREEYAKLEAGEDVKGEGEPECDCSLPASGEHSFFCPANPGANRE